MDKKQQVRKYMSNLKNLRVLFTVICIFILAIGLIIIGRPLGKIILTVALAVVVLWFDFYPFSKKMTTPKSSENKSSKK